MGYRQLKNINTISLKFIEGDRNYTDVVHVLRDQIGLHKEEILGLDFFGKDAVHVKLDNSEVYNTTIEIHGNNKFDTVKGSVIEIIDISSYKTKVSLKNLPFDLPNAVLRNILERHGVVESISNVHHSDSVNEYLSGLLTMERVAIMKSIHTPIPSTYFLSLSQSYIYFSYPNQHRTCTKCGSKDHRGQCPIFSTTAPWKRENVIKFSPDDFPLLQKPLALSNNKDSPKNEPNKTPIHMDATLENTPEKNPPNATIVDTVHDDSTKETTSPVAQPSLDNTQSTIQTANTDLSLEETLSNASSQIISTINADNDSSYQESMLEKNLPNALQPAKSPPNNATVQLDLKSTPERNPLNARTLGESPLNASNVKTNLEPILEKKTNTDLKMSTFSPHQLRQTNSRKSHTYV